MKVFLFQFFWLKIKKVSLISVFLLFFLLPTTIFAHLENVRIEMTESGFEPASLQVHQNSTVEFINLDRKDRWPASNNHPTHDIYPQFDPKKPLKPGQVFKFKFEKVGTWKYHDHLFPHKRGGVTVVAEENSPQITKEVEKPQNPILKFILNFIESLKKIFSPKIKTTSDIKDLTKLPEEEQFKVLEDLAKKEGVEKAWQYFQDTFKGQSGSSGNIHDLAHFVGGLMYDINGFSGLNLCSPAFAFGCFHGFLDKAFSESLLHLNEAEKACLDLGVGGPFSSCIHGIGHGIASFYQTTDLANSLSSCEKLSQGEQFCFDGVFMEFARNAPGSFYSKDNPLYPCEGMIDKYIFSCGRNLPTVLLNRFHYKFDDVVNLCFNSQNLGLKQSCFDALGFLAAAESLGQEKVIIQRCESIKDDEYNARCLNAASGELIFQNTPGWQTSAFKVCSILTNGYRESCEQNLQRIIKDYQR